MAHTLEITAENFETQVLQAKTPVLVDFWASWCGPCRMLAPVIDELAQEFDGKLTVGNINVDEQGALAAQYGIMSIPSVFLFQNGQVIERLVGVRPKAELMELIQKAL